MCIKWDERQLRSYVQRRYSVPGAQPVIRLINRWLASGQAVLVYEDPVLYPPSPVILPERSMHRAPGTCQLIGIYSGPQIRVDHGPVSYADTLAGRAANPPPAPLYPGR